MKVDRFIRCNSARVLLNTVGDTPRLCADWGSEQCEGCGNDIIETGVVLQNSVECSQCKARYYFRSELTPLRSSNR